MNTKTLYTCAWGNYWEKYGKQWISYVEKFNTKPDQVIVISDKKLSNCPYEVLICEVKKPWPIANFRKMAIDHCVTDWLCAYDIDDKAYPNYLDNIDSYYDICTFPIISSTGILFDPRSEHRLSAWENAHKFQKDTIKNGVGIASMPGVSFVKTEVLKKYGINKYGFQDLTLHWKFRKDRENIKIQYRQDVCYEHVYIDKSLSNHVKSKKRKWLESIVFKEYLFDNKRTPIHIKMAETV